MEVATAPPSPLLCLTNSPSTRSRPCKPSVPISIPRRKSVHPPPRSPIRSQASPDLIFNFDFSVSPHGGGLEDEMAKLPLQQRGHMNMLLFQRQRRDRAGYAPFIAADPAANGGLQLEAHPYHREPFLCTIPKLMVRNASGTTRPHLRTQSSPNPLRQTSDDRFGEDIDGSAPDAEFDGMHDRSATAQVLHVRNQSASAAASRYSPTPMSRAQSSHSLVTPQRERQEDAHEDDHIGTDENGQPLHATPPPLTSAFRRPLISSIVTASAAASTSPAAEIPSSPSPIAFRPPTPVSPPSRTPPPRPKAVTVGRAGGRPMPTQIARTPAAPIVSFKVAEADRAPSQSGSSYVSSFVRRGRSPYPSRVPGRARRTSSAGARAGTVLDTGRALCAGDRCVSGVLSSEELERSLEISDVLDQHEKEPQRERGRAPERGAGGWMRDMWGRRGYAQDEEDDDEGYRGGDPLRREKTQEVQRAKRW